MNALYNQAPLFKSGKYNILASGKSLKHVLQKTTTQDGVILSNLGRNGRSIKQTGYLLDDQVSGINKQCQTIEDFLDGQPYQLSDSHGFTYEHTVMISFNRKTLNRSGARWKMLYEIQYLQLLTE